MNDNLLYSCWLYITICYVVGNLPLKKKKKHMAVCQNLVPLVNIKIAGKWVNGCSSH